MFTILYYRECTKHVRYSRVNNGLVYPQILWTKGYVLCIPVWFLLNKLLLLLRVLLALILDFHRTGASKVVAERGCNPNIKAVLQAVEVDQWIGQFVGVELRGHPCGHA